jgi:ribosomal protein L37AE/L43A
MIYLGWNCDFCGKAMLTMSLAGIIYCENCHMSYGETMTKNLDKEKVMEQLFKIAKGIINKDKKLMEMLA